MTAEKPSYVILGRGRWAKVIQGILSAEHRQISGVSESRRESFESEADFRDRLCTAMARTAARIAWLCIPPVPDVPLMVEAGIQAGIHVVIEKPWLCSQPETDTLWKLAKRTGVIAAVHYQYCFLERVQKWRSDFQGGKGLRFGGRFTLSRSPAHGISALNNLGSHLLAIREYALPHSAISGIVCGYDLPDERRVWVETESGTVDSIDFVSNNEPLIQRFIAAMEAAALTHKIFPLDLRFAMRVARALRSIEA